MLDQPSAVVKRFFWLLFFAQAKKSNSPQAKALLLLLQWWSSCRSGFSRDTFLTEPVAAEAAPTKANAQAKKQQQSKSFRPRAGHFSLLAQRKVTKRKRALPTRPPRCA
ncbi:hypothetical protein QSH18_15330, partial [Xanthomonas sp. NCPPB 2654]|uniref:hypothetical protein n=1 Tax=Xanthomonas sp. NCPPB 2654 TaxID=487541 RepID=UPI00256F0843